MKPGLYIIATPIGNMGDMTFRAVEALKAMHTIYCEDTRVSQKLLKHFDIRSMLKVYNDHSNQKNRDHILEAAKQAPIALISDAGSPLIADPGYKLVRQARAEGIYVTVIPGACAAITALSLSGIASDRFYFAGFFEAAKVKELIALDATLIFYESPRRLLKTLSFLQDHMNNRTVSICRELTKLYEETVTGNLSEVLEEFSKRIAIKGEIVIILSPPEKKDLSENDIGTLFSSIPYQGKEAVEFVASTYKLSKKVVYKAYLLYLDTLNA